VIAVGVYVIVSDINSTLQVYSLDRAYQHHSLLCLDHWMRQEVVTFIHSFSNWPVKNLSLTVLFKDAYRKRSRGPVGMG